MEVHLVGVTSVFPRPAKYIALGGEAKRICPLRNAELIFRKHNGQTNIDK